VKGKKTYSEQKKTRFQKKGKKTGGRGQTGIQNRSLHNKRLDSLKGGGGKLPGVAEEKGEETRERGEGSNGTLVKKGERASEKKAEPRLGAVDKPKIV